MSTSHVSERIHAIRTETYPHVSWVSSKVFMSSIDIPLLNRICYVSKHIVVPSVCGKDSIENDQ